MTRAACSIRPATPADAARVAEIYNPYVRETSISFEEAEVSPTEMAARMAKVAEAGLPWLVAQRAGLEGRQSDIVAYAYATRWRERHAYRYSVECTVYTARGCAGQGIGTALYEALFAELRQAGLHAVLAVIALPNAASVALHEKLGMRKVAHFEQVGFKFGTWHDVGNWQRLL